MTLRFIANLEMIALKRDEKSVQACSVAPVVADGFEPPEDVEIICDHSEAEPPNPQIDDGEPADDDF